MKTIKSAVLLAVISLSGAALTACQTDGGDPNFVASNNMPHMAIGKGTPASNLRNIPGVVVTTDGDLFISSQTLQQLNFQTRLLTAEELRALNVSIPDVGVGAQAIMKRGVAVAIRSRNGRVFGIPCGPSVLPGTGITLPSLPVNPVPGAVYGVPGTGACGGGKG